MARVQYSYFQAIIHKYILILNPIMIEVFNQIEILSQNLPTVDSVPYTLITVGILLKAELMVEASEPRDTFFDYDYLTTDYSEWKHGAVFVNGFNIGRYHKGGPQKTLYIPGPLLKQGQ